MARAIMGGDFRAIRRSAPAPVEDPRLALVGQFAAAQGADVQPEPQETAEEPEQEPTGTAAPDVAEAADGPASPEIEDAETSAPVEDPEPKTADKDYDPIAAVLG